MSSVSSDILSGSGFPKEYQGESAGEYPFAKVGTISKAFRAGHKTMNSADNYISENIRVKIKAKSFPKGTIVFPKIGEALKNNYRVITSREMIFDNNVMGIVPDSHHINGDYLYYYLTTKDFGEFAVATAVPSVRRGDVASIPIPLPPIPEQHRIVAKIEELFSELDKGIESLKIAREQLKVYRQALLKHAFEGKLTEKWRVENNGFGVVGARSQTRPDAIATNEPNVADDATDKIKTTVKTNVKGGQVTDRAPTKRRKDLPPLTAEELAALPELPLGWGWVKFENLLVSIKGGTTTVPVDVITDYPILRSSSVRSCKIDFTDIRYLSANGSVDQRNFVKPGDLLFTRLNGTVDYVGNCALVGNKFPVNLMYPDRLYCATIADKKYSKFVELYFSSALPRKSIEKKAKSSAGHKRISIPDITEMPIPITIYEEMELIITVISSQLTIVENLETTITTALQQSETLRQSILKKAFSGQLVPQDPHDEPAALLLERIRAERITTKSVGAKQASPVFDLRGDQNKSQNQGEAGETLASPLRKGSLRKTKKRISA